MEDLGTYYAIK